jgi:hypothetical protein
LIFSTVWFISVVEWALVKSISRICLPLRTMNCAAATYSCLMKACRNILF